MIGRIDIAFALAKCAAYDPVHFPTPSDAVLQAWLEHFGMWPRLTRQDLLDAVRDYYRRPHQPVPQPADISSIAREIHQDNLMRNEAHYREVRDDTRPLTMGEQQQLDEIIDNFKTPDDK